MTYSKWYTICSAFYHTFYACIIHNVDRSSASDYIYTRVCTTYYILLLNFAALSTISNNSTSVSEPFSILPIAEIVHMLCIDCSAVRQNLARILLQMQYIDTSGTSKRMVRRMSRSRDFRPIHRPLPNPLSNLDCLPYELDVRVIYFPFTIFILLPLDSRSHSTEVPLQK